MPRIRYVRSTQLEAVVRDIVESAGLGHVRVDRVFCAVSFGAKTRAYARIWGLPGPFVRLGICEPGYVIEVVYENIKDLSCNRLLAVLVHELLHIPRSFSGGLRGHGEWSRQPNIESIVARIPPSQRRRLCAEARRALERARAELAGEGG